MSKLKITTNQLLEETIKMNKILIERIERLEKLKNYRSGENSAENSPLENPLGPVEKSIDYIFEFKTKFNGQVTPEKKIEMARFGKELEGMMKKYRICQVGACFLKKL